MILSKKHLPYLLAVAAIVGVVTGAYFLGRTNALESNEEVEAELEKLRKSESDAAVVTRVSQQMEEIAYQQKAISDRQKERAEEQSALAILMRDKAEKESAAAKKAEEKAILSAKEATKQRQKAIEHQIAAEEQRDQANYAKSISDTLSYRALGRTLGYSSEIQYEGGKEELACLLAYAGWYFTDKYNGNTFLPEIFKALVTCSNTMKTFPLQKGGGINAICNTGEGFSAVSDYGEVEFHDRNGAPVFYTVQNPAYNFKDALFSDGRLYALSNEGTLVSCEGGNIVNTTFLPKGSYFKLLETDNGKIVTVGREIICIYDKIQQKTKFSGKVLSPISDAVRMEDRIILFHNNGKWETLDADGNIQAMDAYTQLRVTASHYDCTNRNLYLGHTNGDIETFNRNGVYLTTLYGHISQVIDMTTTDGILISTGYDKTIRIWKLSNLQASSRQLLSGEKNNTHLDEWLTPVEYKFSNAWPLCVSNDDENDVLVGLSNGDIVRFCISTEYMASVVLDKMKRNATRDEWNNYIGINIPYVKFK